MKFRKISFVDHPILGNISLDFTDKEGNTVDNIIIAGENGCGKSVLLNELFEFNPTGIHDKRGKITTEIELSSSEMLLVQQNKYMQNYGMTLSDGIIIVEQDFSIHGDWNQCKVYFHGTSGETQLSNGYILTTDHTSIFKPIFSDVEVNYTPKNISNVTSLNIDEEVSNPVRSNNNIATEITQLLIDIDNLDNSDIAHWVDKNPGQVPPEEIKRIRMRRFTNAFHSIFPRKRFVGIDNSRGHKSVLFEEYDKIMTIDKLSSGEKQIVFRGGFLLKNQRSIEGAVVLVDEPEISLHPKWQLEIMTFLKKLFTNNKKQNSQIIVATHSPFIIHNATRANDKVIILKKNDTGEIQVLSTPEFYSWSEAQIVKEAFDINTIVEDNIINVFLEGETDEKYFQKAMDAYGLAEKTIIFQWIGHNKNGSAENTGSSALNNAVKFIMANPCIKQSPIVMLYDCDTHKGSEDYGNLHIRTMDENITNSRFRKGVENLLVLPEEFNYENFYSKKENVDGYGSTNWSLDKMKLCNYICSLETDLAKPVLKNIYSEIEKILGIK